MNAKSILLRKVLRDSTNALSEDFVDWKFKKKGSEEDNGTIMGRLVPGLAPPSSLPKVGKGTRSARRGRDGNSTTVQKQDRVKNESELQENTFEEFNLKRSSKDEEDTSNEEYEKKRKEALAEIETNLAYSKIVAHICQRDTKAMNEKKMLAQAVTANDKRARVGRGVGDLITRPPGFARPTIQTADYCEGRFVDVSYKDLLIGDEIPPPPPVSCQFIKYLQTCGTTYFYVQAEYLNAGYTVATASQQEYGNVTRVTRVRFVSEHRLIPISSLTCH
eukprot:g567.t1